MTSLTYLQGYPEHLLAQVRALIAEQRLGRCWKTLSRRA